jgi:hypothetical protein
LLTTVPSGSVTGVISRAQKPSAIAFSARFCERTPNSSWISRDTPLIWARFSAVCPMARYRSGIRPSSRGSCQVGAPPSARLAVRARASANAGLAVSGSPSLRPNAYRDTHSTPAEMYASPSPALIAWNAIRVVCSDDEQ